MNRLGEILNERCINLRAFSRANGIASSTMYTVISDSSNMERMSINVFMKIAHGLGMTAEELYELCFPKEQDDGEE